MNLSANYQYPKNRPLNVYLLEIQQLKEQLKHKEEAARRLQIDESQHQNKQNEILKSFEMYNRVNKETFDKGRVNEAKKETFKSLQNQLTEEEVQRNIFKLEREKERTRRLEELEKYRGDLEKQRKYQVIRQKEYGEHPTVQAHLRNELIKQQSKLKPDLRTYEIPPPNMINNYLKNDFEKNLQGYNETESKNFKFL